MKALLLATALLAGVAADATAESHVAPIIELQRRETQAADDLRLATAATIYARAKWDAAVAGGHPVTAGMWAQRHFDAMQAERVARVHWYAAARQLAATLAASR